MSCNGDCANCPKANKCDGLKTAITNVRDALENVTTKLLVLSGKGGVGKSTVAYLIARHFAAQEINIGVLDLDLCGPSVPFLFGIVGEKVKSDSRGYEPVSVNDNPFVHVMSTQFFLNSVDDPVTAEASTKNAMVLQMLSEVCWDDVECLVVDTPPGTSDEHLDVVAFTKAAGITGAVVVTTADEVSIADVRREIRFCRRSGLKVLGVIENMAAFKCPKCGKESSIYSHENGDEGIKRLCKEEDVILLGRIPLDPMLVGGVGGADTEISEPVLEALEQIAESIEQQKQ